MADYIQIKEIDLRDGRKTKAFAVLTLDGATCLGRIAWYAPWRKYCYFPYQETIYDHNCLEKITQFMRDENLNHQLLKAVERSFLGAL